MLAARSLSGLVLVTCAAACASGDRSLVTTSAVPAPTGPPAGAGLSVDAGPPPSTFADDALPAGAVARLGTQRYKHASGLSMAVSADGRWLATGGEGTDVQLRRLADGGLERAWKVAPLGLVAGLTFAGDRLVEHDNVWDIATGRLLGELAGSGSLLEGTAANGDRIVGVDGDGRLFAWDAATLARSRPVRIARGAESVALGPSGKQAAVGGDGKVELVDLSSGRRRVVFRTEETVEKLAFVGADRLALADGYNDVVVLGLKDGRVLHRFVMKDDELGAIITDLAVTADGEWLVASANLCDARAWRLATGEPAPRIPTWPEVTAAVERLPAPGGVAIHTRTSVLLWDVPGGKPLVVVPGHSGAIRSVAVSPDGAWIATAATDGFVRQWKLAEHRGRSREAAVAIRTRGTLEAVVFLPDGRAVAAGDEGMTVLQGATPVVLDRGFRAESLDVDDQGRLVSAGGLLSGRALVLADPLGQAALEVGCDTPCRAAAAGAFLAVSGEDDLVIHRLADGAVVAREEPKLSFLYGVAATSSGLVAVAGWQTGALYRIDATTGAPRLVKVRDVHKSDNLIDPAYSPIDSVAFSHDGRLLASGYLDGVVLVEDAVTGARLAELSGHIGRVHALAFAPGDAYLVSGSADGTALVWDAAAWRRPPTTR